MRRQNVNETIRAREVRVVFPDGKTEVMDTRDGVRAAKDLGLDLVLIAPTAQPPVAKIIDYGEYTYLEKKKKNEAKKKQHRIEVKEVKFRPNTDDHDYEFKKNHALRFLEEGNKVKGTVFFRGREITHPEIAEKLLRQLIVDVAEFGEPEGHPRMEGRTMHIMLGPKKKTVKKTDAPQTSKAGASQVDDEDEDDDDSDEDDE
ncbi:MAG: translation initiation factor IF-3 [Bryobacterales bacterium]